MTGGWSVEAKDVSVNGSVLVLDRLGMEISDMLSSKEGLVDRLISAESFWVIPSDSSSGTEYAR